MAELITMESPVSAKQATLEPRIAMLWSLFTVLDEAGVPYCATRGHQGYPVNAAKDVDLVVPAGLLPKRLAALLDGERDRIGAELVQWDSANCIILASTPAAGPPCFIRLDLASDLSWAGRRFYSGTEALGDRRRYERWWVPPLTVEFGFYCVEKVGKGSLTVEDGRRLSALYRTEPIGCEAELRRLWPAESARLIRQAAESGCWDEVRAALPELRAELLRRADRRQWARLYARRVSREWKRAKRWLHPNGGLHIVLLGPDGVGKSSVIETLERELAPAFGLVHSDAFAPSLLRRRARDEAIRDQQGPHALPPRSWPASVAKGLHWAFHYSLGYYRAVYPTLARTGLALNHRYLVDVLVDRRRYRYAGPTWLLKLAWRLARKPDLVILLDAPPEVIQQRKREVTFSETARQRVAYREIVERLPNGRVVDAGGPLAGVVTQVEAIILRQLARRVRRRFGLDHG